MKIFGAIACEKKSTVDQWFGSLAAYCAHCGSPQTFYAHCPNRLFKKMSNFSDALYDLVDDETKTPADFLIGFSPVPLPITDNKIPNHLPETVAKSLLSGIENMNSKYGNDAAVMMFRRAIENAIKEKHPDINGSLIKKIDTLAEQGIFPETIKDWAHQIRVIGNSGAHELEGVTKEDVTDAYNFTDALLRYLITLPAEVKLRREETK